MSSGRICSKGRNRPGLLAASKQGADRYGLVALLCYVLLSFLFFGRGLIGHFSTCHIGRGADPPLMLWFLVWWPHALSHGLNPFLTRSIWAPKGFNVTWQTSIPLISILAAPLTDIFGVVPTFNLLAITGIVLSAWCAFVLCRHLTQCYWASLLGGYIFAFCPVLLGGMAFGHLFLTWAFPIPLLLYLLARRLSNEISLACFVCAFAVLLVVEFLTSLEVFATLSLFGSMALVVGWLLTPGDRRPQVWKLIKQVVVSYSIAVVVVSPFIYIFLAVGFHRHSVWPVTSLSADVLNLLVPTPLNELGKLTMFNRMSMAFNASNLSNAGAFLSWPLLLVAVFYARRSWSQPKGRLMVNLLIIVVICSLGPLAIINGSETRIALPWIVAQVPILNNAAPGRFMAYAYLILAVMASLLLADSSLKRHWKVMFALAIIVCGLPNMDKMVWTGSARSPAFFTHQLYRRYLHPDETALILPWGDTGNVSLWQAEAHMYFRVAEGPGPLVNDYRMWPIVAAFERSSYVPDAVAQLKAFLENHDVTAVIVTDQAFPIWSGLLSSLSATPVHLGGVRLYRWAPNRVEARPDDLQTMRIRFDTARFETVLAHLEQFVRKGGNVRDLTGRDARELSLVPADSVFGSRRAPYWCRDPERYWFNRHRFFGMFLLPLSGGRIEIGARVWSAAAKLLTARYGATAGKVVFIADPGSRKDPSAMGMLAMIFDKQQLARAAEAPLHPLAGSTPASPSLRAEPAVALP